MKRNLLTTITLGAVLALAAASPASADPLFSGATLGDLNLCRSSTAYPLDEMRACDRAMGDLNAQSEATTNQIDLQNVDLMMANVGIIEGFLCQQLGFDGSQDTFSSARSLLETILEKAASSDIADRASTMLAMMDKDGI